MIKCLYPLFLSILFFGKLHGQPDSLKSKTDKSSGAGLDVLFATNEDCDLFVNGELRGTALKSDFFYTKLPVGNYQYKAKSKATGDELRDSFSVKAGAANEVFIDLLYFVDERMAQRQAADPKNKTFGSPTSGDEKNPAAFKPGNEAKFTNSDAKTGVINLLLGTMVFLEGGKFIMGNSRSPLANETEHPVAIDSFFVCRYEITQHQWETFMGYNPSINKGCPTCPVEFVSWNETMSFIQKLNAASGRKFRLPTEAEWEFMAKVGGKTEIDEAGGQEQYIKKTAWYYGNANKKTQPVGRRLPNAAGIFDLTGNVSEWCADWYGASYYKESMNKKNPLGPSAGKEKVIRGGNLKDYIGDRFRPSIRGRRPAAYTGSELGFRLVMDATQ